MEKRIKDDLLEKVQGLELLLSELREILSGPDFSDQVQDEYPLWLSLALGELGVAEIPGPKCNPRILEYHATVKDAVLTKETESWCASFVNWCLEKSGKPSTSSGLARRYTHYGVQSDRKPGAICVFKRGTQSWMGHVGFYLSEDSNRILLLSGNTSNKVTKDYFSIDDLLAVRWPN
jgi:uncharacterized protein (TIGR02594 family)